MTELYSFPDEATLEALMTQCSGPVTPLPGTLIKGTVHRIDTKYGAWIDFGGKNDALVPMQELLDAPLSVGDSTTFFVLSVPENDEPCGMNKQWNGSIFSATRARSWHDMQQHLTNRTNVSVKVTRVARNRTGGIAGVNVVAGNLHGFVPYTKLGSGMQAVETLIGSQLQVKVQQVSPDTRKLIFNRLECLAEEAAAINNRREELFATLKPGDIRSGKVVRLADYGAFVDVGEGLHGLVHRSELTSDSKRPIAQLIKIGEEMPVKVIRAEMKEGKRQLALSVKQLRQASFLSNVKIGDYLEGTVSRLTDFGCFVQLSAEHRVDGLIHKSQYSSAIRQGQQSLNAGDVLVLKVIELDKSKGRIGLSLRDVSQLQVDSQSERTEKSA